MTARIPVKIALFALLACFLPLFFLGNFTSVFQPSAPAGYQHPLPISGTMQGNMHSLGGEGGYQASTLYLAPCAGTPQTPVDMLKKDWGITNDKLLLTEKYWNTKDKLLCNDHWTWRSGEMISWSDVLKQLQWPSDLIQPSMLNQKTTVQALTTVDPATQKQQQQQVAQQEAADAQSKNACDIVMPILGWDFHLDVCGLLKTIVNSAIVKPIKDTCQNIINQANTFLWSTPPADTYDLSKNQTMAYFNLGVLNLVNILIVLVVAYLGVRYILGGGFSWLEYAKIQETLPRLLFGLIAAYFAMQIAKVVIDGSNALCSLFHGDMIRTMFTSQANGTVAGIIQVLYALMGVLLVIEEGARYAILYILLAFLPIILFCSALKETAHYAKNGIKALIFFTFLQPAQLAVMDLGQAVLTHVMSNDPGNILNYIVGIAIMIVVLSLFFSVSRMAFGGAFQPLGALATGATAGLAIGGAKFGGKKLLKGREKINQVADSALEALPGIARKTPAAAVATYQGIRNAPQTFRTGAANLVSHAKKAGTHIASLTPGHAIRHSSPVNYTGNAATTIAAGKKQAYTPKSIDQTADHHARRYTPQEIRKIRAYNAQYQGRWKSNPPKNNRTGR